MGRPTIASRQHKQFSMRLTATHENQLSMDSLILHYRSHVNLEGGKPTIFQWRRFMYNDQKQASSDFNRRVGNWAFREVRSVKTYSLFHHSRPLPNHSRPLPPVVPQLFIIIGPYPPFVPQLFQLWNTNFKLVQWLVISPDTILPELIKTF